MSDRPEALRLADELTACVGTQSTYSAMQQAADELRRLHDEIVRLKAERDALKAAAEKGTEYVLAHINQDLRAERDALLAALRDAKEYARNPDYDWDSKFWRDVNALIAAIDAARSKT